MRQSLLLSFALSVVGVSSLAGCTPGRGNNNCKVNCNNGGDGGTTGGALTITPPSASLVVSGGPASQQFGAVYLGNQNVSELVTWSVGDPSFGTITSSGLFTTQYPLGHGGTVNVQANYMGVAAAASVTINYTAPDVVDVSAPQDAPNWFGGSDSTDITEKPKVVYPFSDTMLARNINQMNLQWSALAKDKLFHIHVVGTTIDSSFYVGSSACKLGTSCSYKFKDANWQTIAQSASGKSVTITIRGTAAMGAAVATSQEITVNFSPEDVKGGLYYFSTSIRGIKRLPFGASQATDFITNGNSTGCVGCHAVSRDGKKVVAVFGGADGYAGMVKGDNGQSYIIQPDMTQKTYYWNFESFSPDGKEMITNWAGKLELRNGDTGALIKAIPQSLYGAKQAVMPEWSPDGKKIAFVGIPAEGYIGKDMTTFGLVAGDWILGNGGSIMVMDYNNGNFAQATTLVPSVKNSEYHFYPSWSPDSQWVVFATGKYPGSSPTAANNGVDTTGKCMSYDQDTARLRLVSVTGTAPVELTAATHAMNRTSSWPKFAPFVQGNLVFFTFSSKFAYGFVVPDSARPQIWMSAIDLEKAKSELGVGDPSYPPFWLPFQDPTQNNHETIWTTDVACVTGTDCPVEFSCENGMCVPKVG